jgi:hypothetical protein
MCLPDKEEETQRLLISAAITASNVSYENAWRRYVEYTGLVDRLGIHAYLAGIVSLPVVECNLLAHAVNELIDEQPAPPRAPHRNTPTGPPSVAECAKDIESHEAVRDIFSQLLLSVTHDKTVPPAGGVNNQRQGQTIT